ncbi:GGDEF domain-containing protein [Neiella marina]|nr:GGDEF domain-containing protein [Neiella marina]
MQKAVANLNEDEIQALKNRWLGVTLKQQFDYLLLWKIAGVVAIIVVLGFLRYRELSTLNRKISESNQQLMTAKRELELLSTTDHLTGIANRKKLDEQLIREIYRTKRYQHPLGVMLVDFDRFKQVNDTFGHAMGDRLLSQAATIFSANIRQSDFVGRWGGEEFMLICPETPLASLEILANNLRQTIANSSFETAQVQTASFGIASYQPGETMEAFWQRADKALYRAKKGGRNRVEVAS